MPGIYRKDEKAYIHTKNLMYMNIHRSFICNSQNLKTQMSLNVGNKFGVFTPWSTIQQWKKISF